MMHETHPQDLSVLMPITQEAQQLAIQFAKEQPTTQKADQVYFNTLAVCTVNNYLRIMDFSTDLTAGDSWDPVVRLAADVADLWVNGRGRLECRPWRSLNRDVKTAQSNMHRFRNSKPDPQMHNPYCSIPLEVQCDRIGYVVVQIDSERQEAKLLGFSQTAADQLSIVQLQPIHALLEHLDTIPLPTTPVKLGQWLQEIFEVGWQSVESLLDTPTANYGFRRRIANGIRRAKSINMGTPIAETTVALAVTLIPQAAGFGISLQVLPLRDNYLPNGLKLTVLDESAATFLEVTSGDIDNSIQTRQFGGQPGEKFGVQVSLGENSVTEEFVV